ncbi:MAG: hypothetical protein K0R51_2594 [Cytophagaceae bacterium]|jgi:capsular polysaccharide biosynthesis protein|nr:hypothetical protein [Cytophagaceae bacterium]
MQHKKLLIPAQKVIRKLPENYRQDDELYFAAQFENETPDVFLIDFRNVNVSVAGTVFSFLHTFALSVKEDFVKKLNWVYVLYNLLTRQKQAALPDQKHVLFFNNLSECYYHWMTEAVPRLFLVKDHLEDRKILLPESYRGFQLKSLKAFGITEAQVTFIGKKEYYQVQNLLMPSFAGKEQTYNKKLLQELGSYYLKEVTKATVQKPFDTSRIYVKRKATSIRHVINEDEVVACLKSFGFKDIFFEDYSFEEQVQLASEARQLISIHGAGLTNMLFMNKGTQVLEFRKEKEKGYLHYFTLADALELRYYYQFCQPEDETKASKDANILVDIELLKRNVELMLTQE